MSTVKLGQPRGNRSHATTTVTPAGKALKPSTRTPKTLKPPKSALKAAEKARARALADAELDRERQLSTTRLKTCWELIFEKYGKDMEDVADVVDPWTGDIIVDNGHIRGLQNECDLPENEDVFPWSELLGPEDTDERIKKRKRDSLDDGTKQVRATKTQRVPLPKECFGGCKYGILATCSVCGSDELERVPLSQIMDEPLPEPSESERIPLMQITEGPWDEKNNTLPSPPRRRDILQPASPALAKLPSDDFVLGRLGATQGSAVLKALALQISLSRENPPAPPETTVVAAHEPNALISTPSSPEQFAATTIQLLRPTKVPGRSVTDLALVYKSVSKPSTEPDPTPIAAPVSKPSTVPVSKSPAKPSSTPSPGPSLPQTTPTPSPSKMPTDQPHINEISRSAWKPSLGRKTTAIAFITNDEIDELSAPNTPEVRSTPIRRLPSKSNINASNPSNHLRELPSHRSASISFARSRPNDNLEDEFNSPMTPNISSAPTPATRKTISNYELTNSKRKSKPPTWGHSTTPKVPPGETPSNIWSGPADDPFYNPLWDDEHPDGTPSKFPPPPKEYTSLTPAPPKLKTQNVTNSSAKPSVPAVPLSTKAAGLSKANSTPKTPAITTDVELSRKKLSPLKNISGASHSQIQDLPALGLTDPPVSCNPEISEILDETRELDGKPSRSVSARKPKIHPTPGWTGASARSGSLILDSVHEDPGEALRKSDKKCKPITISVEITPGLEPSHVDYVSPTIKSHRKIKATPRPLPADSKSTPSIKPNNRPRMCGDKGFDCNNFCFKCMSGSADELSA